MIPFKVFDRDKKITWMIINYHQSSKGGEYLAAREDDSEKDGQIEVIPAKSLEGLKMLGFVDEQE